MDSSSDDEGVRTRREEDRPHHSVAGRDGKIRADQFDVRINCEQEDLRWMKNVMESEYNCGTLKYGHISHLEYGDDPSKSSYQHNHVHIALVYRHRSTIRAVLKKYGIKNQSWYCKPRDKKLPLAGWVSYHSKARTKVDKTGLYFNIGVLPNDNKRNMEVLDTSDDDDIDPKTKKRAKQWKRRKELMMKQDWERLDLEFPGFIWTTQGKNMRIELIKKQPKPPNLEDLDNFIIYGETGTGKSSSISYLGFDYKKQKGSQYWDHYDQAKDYTQHGNTVWIDEMSKETLATLQGKLDGGFEFLKELGDRYPVMVDAKYLGSFYIRPKRILITMNEHPSSLLPDRSPGVNAAALYRKFKVMHASEWLTYNNLELIKLFDKDGEPLLDNRGQQKCKIVSNGSTTKQSTNARDHQCSECSTEDD